MYVIMTILSYIIYLHIAAWITFWVGHSLHKNGRYFLVEAFANERIADAVNTMLLVGFYLINFAYVLIAMKENQEILNFTMLIETVSKKTGLIVFILATMHFFNLFVFSMIRQYGVDALKHKIINLVTKKKS